MHGVMVDLVTSVAHMPRALRLIRAASIKPLPAPTDYIIINKPGDVFRRHLNACDNFYISQLLFYEWPGSLCSKVKWS